MPQLEKINFQYNNTINAVSKVQYDVHLALYEGYVNKINEIWRELNSAPDRESANATYSKYRGLKKGETYALNGVILHELYFDNLGGSNNTLGGAALTLINQFFGSYENWKEDFIACGKATRGWAVLAYDQRSKSLVNILCDSHDEGNVWNAYPLIIMDVYEHAYFVDYQNKKADYIDKFMLDINWDAVNRRAQKLIK
ncbi:MAG TPA: superoxide dismutase [Patescibacteria group bacterium]|nr:superoxide dismutase [Patescibacteria group bacterium]